MIVTFPFEDDPYYKPVYDPGTAAVSALVGTPIQPRSYPFTEGAERDTPELVKKYLYMALSSGRIFPVGSNWALHGGVHLSGTKPIRAVANGTIVAYRLDTDYYDSELHKQVNPKQPRKYAASFVLIRHECDVKDPNITVNRYKNAHFYSLYANLMPQKQLDTQSLLPPFLTTGPKRLAVQALRGDLAEVTAVNPDGHNMVKVKLTDINTSGVAEGWLELMYLEAKPVPEVGKKIRLSYPVASLYANHPGAKKWIALDATKTLDYPVRVGEIIGYAGNTEAPTHVTNNSFHFEIFTADNLLAKTMKPLTTANLASILGTKQEYAKGSPGQAMGKVWLMRDADVFDAAFRDSSFPTATQSTFHKGDCFLAAIPCGPNGAESTLNDAPCFKLIAMNGSSYYAYATQARAAADTLNGSRVSNAWVSLTTDTDWVRRGWLAFEEEDLGSFMPQDAIIDDNDKVMQTIANEAFNTPSNYSAAELADEGLDTIVRRLAVQFHTEWDAQGVGERYAKLKSKAHTQVPTLTEAQFATFTKDIKRQQFWADASVKEDGVNSVMQPLTTPMDPRNWHWHPIGFLAQMRECLTTDSWMSEEDFEVSIRSHWVTALKLIERRLQHLEPWEPWSRNGGLCPTPPATAPVVVKEYTTSQTLNNPVPQDLWGNFEYWFGVSPNTLAQPEAGDGALPSKPAAVHVYEYLLGMKKFFQHVCMERVIKGPEGFEAGAFVFSGSFPRHKPLSVAKQNPAERDLSKRDFNMEYIHICCQYGTSFAPFNKTAAVDQNRMEVQMHEIAHLKNTANAKDKKIVLPLTVTRDPLNVNGQVGYGSVCVRVLAEVSPNLALANAENIAFFIESAKFGMNL